MRKLLFALLCLSLVCVSCSKDNDEKYSEGIPDGGNNSREEKPIVLPKDTIIYKNQTSYGCYYAFVENSTHTLSFRTDFDYEIVIKTKDLNWERIKKAVDTKVNILEYNVDILPPLIESISIKNVSPMFDETEIFDLKKSKAYIDFVNWSQEGRFFRLMFEGEDITIKVLLKYEGS